MFEIFIWDPLWVDFYVDFFFQFFAYACPFFPAAFVERLSCLHWNTFAPLWKKSVGHICVCLYLEPICIGSLLHAKQHFCFPFPTWVFGSYFWTSQSWKRMFQFTETFLVFFFFFLMARKGCLGKPPNCVSSIFFPKTSH